MNLGDMRTEFQARGFNHLSTARCNYFLNNAYTDLCEADLAQGGVWPFLLTTLSGAAPLAIPDLRQFISVEDMVTKIPLEPIDRRTLMEQISGDATLPGTPLYWYFDDQTPAVENLVTNPSFEVDLSGWSTTGTGSYVAAGAVMARSTAQADFGTASGSVSTTLDTQGITIPVSVGQGNTYTLSMYIKGAAGGENVVIFLGQADGLVTASQAVLGATTSWQRVSTTWAATTAAAEVIIRISGNGAKQFFVDGVMVTQGSTAPTYFDGDSSGAEWTGLHHASTSIQNVSDTLRVYPVGTDSLTVRYARIPPALSSDADVPLVPDRYVSLIVDGAVIQGYMDSDNLMSAYALQNTWDAGVLKMADSLLFRDGRTPDMVASVADHADWP